MPGFCYATATPVGMSPHSSAASLVRPSGAGFDIAATATGSCPVFVGLMFSATFRKKVERLARDVLSDPVRIVVGDLGEVC